MYLFTSTDRKHYVVYLLGSLTAKYIEFFNIHYRKARRIHVGGEATMPVQMDRELVGNLPMAFEVARRAGDFFVPA